MSNLKGYIKAYNQMPKPNSKSHQKKEEYLKNHPVKYVGCSKCGKTDTTLYNIMDKYYCKDCIPVENEEKQ